MTEKFSKQDVSPMKSFYDSLSGDEKSILAENERWVNTGQETLSVATRDVSSDPFDDIVTNNKRVTLLRFTARDGSVKVFSFAHDYVLDLSKLKPVEYGLSSDALIGTWTPLEWMRAKETAIAQALDTIDQNSRSGLMFEFVQIENGEQVQP